MKLKLIFSLFLLLFCSNLWAEYPWNDEDVYYEPFGKVDMVNIKIYIIDGEKRTLSEYRKVFIDKQNGKRELHRYQPDGTLKESIFVEENGKGNMTSYKEYDNNKKLLWMETIVYNSENQMINREICKKGDESCDKFIYTYNSSSRLIKRESSFPEPKKNYYKIIEYNDNRKKTSTYYSKGELEDYYIEIFNSDGNRIEFTSYDAKGKETSKLVSMYEKKRIIEEYDVSYFSGNKDYYSYKYIDKENENTKLTYKNKKLIKKEISTYNKNKVVSHLVEEYTDGTISESEFEKYDNIGNIKLKRIFADKQTTETIYEYEYKDGD